MVVTTTDILRLALLMTAVGTAVLAVALVLAYRRSGRLAHIFPLALAFSGLSVVATLRGWLVITLDQALWACIAAFAIGDVGMMILLARRGGPRQ